MCGDQFAAEKHRAADVLPPLCALCLLALRAPPPLPRGQVLTPLALGPEFTEATALFIRTLGGPAVIERVFRVVNPPLAAMFELCRERLGRELHPTGECLMFHGTDRKAAGSICRSGFEIRYSGSHGQALGTGVYFGRKASYAHDFTVKDVGDKRCMVVARVLPGKAGKQTDPPGTYDHVRRSSDDIIVVKREQQACPLYVIYYS